MTVDMFSCAEHILDWFHITMRLPVLGQYAKGLAHHDEKEAQDVSRQRTCSCRRAHGHQELCRRSDGPSHVPGKSRLPHIILRLSGSLGPRCHAGTSHSARRASRIGPR